MSNKDLLLQRESSGNYQAENQYGFMGGYQMGGAALYDSGYLKDKPKGVKWNDWANSDEAWTGKNGATSKQAFMNTPEIQDQAFGDYQDALWRQLVAKGADKYIGQTINGTKITRDGLLRSAHLVGAGGTNSALRDGNLNSVKDANGTSAFEYMNLGGNKVSKKEEEDKFGKPRFNTQGGEDPGYTTDPNKIQEMRVKGALFDEKYDAHDQNSTTSSNVRVGANDVTDAEQAQRDVDVARFARQNREEADKDKYHPYRGAQVDDEPLPREIGIVAPDEVGVEDSRGEVLSFSPTAAEVDKGSTVLREQPDGTVVEEDAPWYLRMAQGLGKALKGAAIGYHIGAETELYKSGGLEEIFGPLNSEAEERKLKAERTKYAQDMVKNGHSSEEAAKYIKTGDLTNFSQKSKPMSVSDQIALKKYNDEQAKQTTETAEAKDAEFKADRNLIPELRNGIQEIDTYLNDLDRLYEATEGYGPIDALASSTNVYNTQAHKDKGNINKYVIGSALESLQAFKGPTTDFEYLKSEAKNVNLSDAKDVERFLRKVKREMENAQRDIAAKYRIS